MENNKPAFTPGPWVLNVVRHGKGQYTSIEAPHLAGYHKDILTVYCTDYPEMAANAQLAVAAPDLYEALEALTGLAELEQIGMEQEGAPALAIGGIKHLIDKANAALAKARGEVKE